jgi:teichuronic acid biosynthesis glycosyltransferase TuaC
MVTSEWPTPERPEMAPFLVQQVKSLRELGIQIDVFTFRGNKNPLNYIKARTLLRQNHRFSQYDLIHLQFGQSGAVALPTELPVVVTFWGSDLHGIVGKDGRYSWRSVPLRWLSRSVAKRANEIILVSKHLSLFLHPELAYHVIPHGIDFGLFYPRSQKDTRRQLGLNLDKKFVLFAADPNRAEKRYFLARKAVDLLKDKYDVALLLTSTHEGSPTVVKEALACNLPVVSVDVGDVRERIAKIEGCILSEDDSPETIANGLAEVLRKGMRIAGCKAVGDLDERLVAERIICVYHKALSRA